MKYSYTIATAWLLTWPLTLSYISQSFLPFTYFCGILSLLAVPAYHSAREATVFATALISPILFFVPALTNDPFYFIFSAIIWLAISFAVSEKFGNELRRLLPPAKKNLSLLLQAWLAQNAPNVTLTPAICENGSLNFYSSEKMSGNVAKKAKRFMDKANHRCDWPQEWKENTPFYPKNTVKGAFLHAQVNKPKGSAYSGKALSAHQHLQALSDPAFQKDGAS